MLVDDIEFNSAFLEELLKSNWNLKSISFDSGHSALTCY